MVQRTKNTALEEAWEPRERPLGAGGFDELLGARRLEEGLESEVELLH